MLGEFSDNLFSVFSDMGLLFGVPLFILAVILVIVFAIGKKKAGKLKQGFAEALKQNGLSVNESDIIYSGFSKAYLGFDFDKKIFSYAERLKDKSLNCNMYGFDDLIEVAIQKDDHMVISNQKDRLLSAAEVKVKADAFSYPDKNGLHTISLVIRLKDENRPVIKMVLYKSTMPVKLDPNKMDYNIHVPAAKCFEKASHAMLEAMQVE